MQDKVGIHSTIRDRWSTRAFDPSRPIEPDKLSLLFEAFRWAPSSGNGQPGHVIAGVNFDKCHQDIFSTLRESNQVWAQSAPLLLITVAQMSRNDRPNRFAFHDVGLASQNLLLQAWELGLHCHLMGGFSPDDARELFGIPPDYEPVAAGAVGYIGKSDSLPEDLQIRETETRQRKTLDEFVFTGKWNTPLSI